MRDELAEQLLAKVMGWEGERLARFGSDLQMLAAHKYDEYDGYLPGVKFLENLSSWLSQFEAEDRAAAMRFVLEDLIFISQAELDHLIETVYPDVVRPMLVREAAGRLGISRFRVAEIARSEEFHHVRRKMLVLGLSDGARIDRFRRASPGLSHEQIYLAVDIAEETIAGAHEKLRKALKDDSAQFESVLLVDDFYGSGFTLIRKEEDGSFEGRLVRARAKLDTLVEAGALKDGATVVILVYLASQDAVDYVSEMLAEAGLAWTLEVIQKLPAELKVTDPELVKLCEWHFDDVLVDEHKRGRTPLGFRDCALPLSLHHNTPNNSVCVLWADTSDRDKGLKRRALFPRYERHRTDRQ